VAVGLHDHLSDHSVFEGLFVDVVTSLSPALWDLLQRTRLRPDVALELFDPALTPLLPPSDDPRAVAVRRAATLRFHAGAETSFRTILQSGRDARLTFDEWDITLLPVRDLAEPIALLAAVARDIQDGSREWVEPGPAETVARAWRDAIERDLSHARRSRGQDQLTNRARALASFVADLQQSANEPELLNALLQAIAVWHDVEPCVYTRDLAGSFILRATLPGTDPSSVPHAIDAATVVNAMGGREGEPSWPILTQLGWRGKGTPLLLLVSSGSLEEWLIALSGTHESDIHQQLEPLLRGFSTGMERVREREARKLRQQLWDTIVGWPEEGDLQGLGTEILSVLGRSVEATHGLLTVGQEAEQPSTAIALVGKEADPTLLRDGRFTASALSVTYPLGSGRIATLELRRAGQDAFRASHVTAVLGVRPLLGAWLAGLGQSAEWKSTFATPESSRVLRFTDSPSSPTWT
jgi:hypothetical protein